MLEFVKLCLRVTTDAFDEEITMLIQDAVDEMASLGIVNIYTDSDAGRIYDTQAKSTIVAYCKWKFGDNENKDEWRDVYHTKVAQMKTSSAHTDWRL